MRSKFTTGTHNQSTLPGLELLRGLACLEVLLLHLPWPDNQFLIVTHWIFGGWGAQAVIVFFVLSGYVIALSQEKNHRPFLEFMRARFRRLLPLYIFAIMLTIPVEIALHPETPIRDAVFLHLSFLQYNGYYFFCNIPLWSLSYEFYFYLLFALTMGRWQAPLRLLWCLLGLGAIVASSFQVTFSGLGGHLYGILAFSPIWILGSILIYDRYFPHFSLKQSLVLLGSIALLKNLPSLLPAPDMPQLGPVTSLLIGLLVAPLVCYLARLPGESLSSRPGISWTFVAGLYLLLVIFFILTATWKNSHFANIVCLAYAPCLFFAPAAYRFLFRDRPFFNPLVTAFSLGLGKMSYAVYIIHWPLLLVAAALVPNVPLQLAIVLPAIFGLAWLMEFRLQPWLTSWFDIIWPSVRQKQHRERTTPVIKLEDNLSKE